MKKMKYVIIGIVCICLILVGFFFFSKDNVTTDKDLTEVEKLIVRDLEEDYPKTPREVMKFYIFRPSIVMKKNYHVVAVFLKSLNFFKLSKCKF